MRFMAAHNNYLPRTHHINNHRPHFVRITDESSHDIAADTLWIAASGRYLVAFWRRCAQSNFHRRPLGADSDQWIWAVLAKSLQGSDEGYGTIEAWQWHS
jgi:hypothetical protein